MTKTNLRRSALAAVLALGTMISACSSVSGAKSEQWEALFDGSSLSSWTQTGDANWRIVDGAVEANAGRGLLVSKLTYQDFRLTAEFWVSDDANSGVFVRCADPATIADTTCYEVNIFDRRPDPTYRTGGIVRIAPPSQKIDAGGRWNTYDITVQGGHLVVNLNGVQTVDVNDGKFNDGYIALQYGGGMVKFRNVRVHAL